MTQSNEPVKSEAFNFKTASPDDLKAEYARIAAKIGDDQFFTKKELAHLPKVLQDGEQVLAFSSGLMDGNTWLITLTDKRIIFLDKGLIYGLKQIAIDLDKVNAISGKTGMMFGKISIQDGATERTVSNVWKKTVVSFTNAVQNAIAQRKMAVSASPSMDPYERLEKLAQLMEKGIISEEEFIQEKKKLLE